MNDQGMFQAIIPCCLTEDLLCVSLICNIPVDLQGDYDLPFLLLFGNNCIHVRPR